MQRTVLEGVGSYLPERIVTNDELATRIDTSDAWIRERTGIGQRHIAAAHETATFMGAEAARRALAAAGASADSVDAVIVATSTPDQGFPATAVSIQAAIGMTRGFAFDLSAACSGFVYGVSVADAMIRAGQCRSALVIGTEVYSRILNWEDRGTCVLFGDGAGAVLLRAGTGEDDRGVISTHIHSDGRYGDILFIDGATGQDDRPQHLVMNGREVFRHAVSKLAGAVDEALAANDLTQADIDWLVPHQANRRIIDAMGKRLGLAPEQVVVTVDRHANTSAASIPLALDEAVRDGRIRRGHLVLIEALGGGLTWGSALIRF
ncbi:MULTISPECIES: beta-ketoacyl-ACP synthase III [Acidiphilium]|jgi:3-oxoacyl-[acyl-carrier-protein] synthase-3|uniref:beta-ketoacyl-ACP synthase III n=1 Tax=Acidiphilium TaxID=522 RepID=UPI000214596C|nr:MULTISPECIES: beta-ketoacyl-ACP synthase III [Acidiphilium]MBU6358249.1 ketoacyl-ACP synthase III [Rhodospirillales bacterium]EGO96576.1 3-oxoacyl-[acyl-carrier-protein] synthase 3 [Acidiphilium sp. PM]KDM66359.1 3-oxoacyl-[acyl-carrier-protein] synthase FabH [Acidiphilium sp. JA12-A1]MDE2328382.1 ketoacyl-ACP synthase III [Rhodospirillales bacterium]UNC13234.1 ketoacyl-ACP synthase III [Acidiphilium multivorum]